MGSAALLALFGVSHTQSEVHAINVLCNVFLPSLANPENVGVTQQFRPLLGPREGMGEVANSDCVPLSWGSRDCKGYVGIPPSFGPSRRQG